MYLFVACGSLLTGMEPNSFNFILLITAAEETATYSFRIQLNCFLVHRKVWNSYDNESD